MQGLGLDKEIRAIGKGATFGEPDCSATVFSAVRLSCRRPDMAKAEMQKALLLQNDEPTKNPVRNGQKT